MRRGNHIKTWWVAFTLIATLGMAQARAADAYVYVSIFGFSPNSVTINVGERVYFIVDDDNGPYCIQSTTGAWTPWYLFDYGDGFYMQINEKGDYYYREVASGHTGVIHVSGSVNVPPSVDNVSPAEGATFTEPASFSFSATVSDPDNGVASVEFYVDSTLVGTVYSSPYSVQVTNLAAGDHALVVAAYDNAWVLTLASVNIKVLPWTPPPTITLGPPSVVGGQFQFDVTGVSVGKQVVLQASSSPGDAANWVSLQTNTASSATVTFSSAVLPGSRFFRVVQLP